MRTILLVIHPSKLEARIFATELAKELHSQGFSIVSAKPTEIEHVIALSDPGQIANLELAIVLGGDGTILRAAEIVRSYPIPILGINLGNVGFLAEVSKPTIAEIVFSIREKKFHSEPRLLLHFNLMRNHQIHYSGWALNEVTIERNNEQMVELFVQIDGRPLSRWGCDGVICATPTGSTAYAFSAGGPVVWPEVNALVLLPLAAHALFSRPMVISPDSEIAIDVESAAAHLSADGMRKIQLLQHDRIILTKDEHRVYLTHIEDSVFTDRLVAKFKLPIEGWRGE
jgi:NAD+ kinase